MHELKPSTSLGPLKKALDNGGRFYNFFDDENDEKISRGELAKAAGVFTAGIQAFLYLQMTKQDLDDRDQQTVIAMLDDKLRKSFEKKKPAFVAPSQVDANHKAGEAVIVTGFAREIDQQKLFTGFIIVPIMIGKVMMPMMIPIHSLYRIIEVCDDDKFKKPTSVVATPIKKPLDVSGMVQFGGVLKELKGKDNQPPTHPVYLEAIYWMKR